MITTSLSDSPYKETEYDFKTKYYVDGLVQFITNATAPLTIALQGEWGSGKTSLMTRLHNELCSGTDSKFIGISINTWEYSMLASPEETVYNILGKLVKEISKNHSKVKKILKRFINNPGRMLYKGGREVFKVVGGKLVSVALETLTPSDIQENEDDTSLSELRESLEEAVQQRITEDKKNGVIIFVDDLDRLNPPVAVEILELLKNVFTIDNCIFVLAIDYDVVVKGLEPKFGKLTNRNEREFRSFFDKIIQVPFSLPVSSYKPMTFVMSSLKNIGYLTDLKLTEEDEKLFEDVLESSVGNNPRSLKRLINTLSLLGCITKAKQNDSENGANRDTNAQKPVLNDKLLNFIIVAIQICYPRIYSLLVHKPNFTEWNREFAIREGIDSISTIDDEDPDWNEILDAACSADKFLAQRYLDISKLFSMIMKFAGNTPESIGKNLTDILDNTAVTGVRTSVKVENFDKKEFINKLHENIERRIHQLRPDIERIKPRNNTGNGGFNFRVDNGRKYDIRFVPSHTPDNTVTLKLEMNTEIRRPERTLGMSLEDLLKDPRLSNALSEFDSKISPLLQDRLLSSEKSSFTSFSEELRHFHEMGHMSGDVTHAAEYRINLPRPSEFETQRIVDAITTAVIANYDFRKAMSEWT